MTRQPSQRQLLRSMIESSSDASASSSTVNERPTASSSSGYSGRVTVGTAADLIARGPPQACAGCTLATLDQGSTPMPQKNDGLFFQRGWVGLCSTHNNFARSQEAKSYACPAPSTIPVKPRPLPTLPQAQQPTVVSISERWRRQMRKQRKRVRKQASGHAPIGGVSATAEVIR